VTKLRDLGGWLVRLAIVGSVAALVDIGWLSVLHDAGVPLLVANGIAIADAALISYALNRMVTFRNYPYVRWIYEPTVYIAVVVLGAVWDSAVLLIGTGQGFSVVGAKVLAVGSGAVIRTGAYWWILSRTVRHRDLEPAASRPAPPGELRLSVVIPAYHEETRIGSTLELLRTALAEVDGGVELIVVDDGSADRTAAAAREAGADQVIVQPQNRGKGAAVRAGMLAARGRTIAFTDADLAYSPDQLLPLLDRVEEGWDMVAGSRHHEGTNTLVRARRLREVGSRLVNLCTMLLLLGIYRDTQCGLKAFRSDAAKRIFGHAHVDGFAFDIELFHLANRYEYAVLDVPVKVENSEQSTVKVVRDALRLVRDVLRIRRWDRSGTYSN
jgi:dolichyl-phosphate beta-glucosyltransferase